MNDQKMNWHALRMNCCPQCGEDFIEGMRVGGSLNWDEQMLIHQCGFKIRQSKYDQIVKKEYIQK